MPTISDPNLTLSEADGFVTIRVRYNVTFSPFDRALSGLGRRWHSHVYVHGYDGGDDLAEQMTAADFDRVDFNVTPGTTDQVIPQDVTKRVARSALQEDPAGNADELKARVRIHSNQTVEEWLDAISDQEVLTSAP
jgi:pyruvate formate-lyase activating enzyme-like uncharacterized protein